MSEWGKQFETKQKFVSEISQQILILYEALKGAVYCRAS